MPPRPSIRTAFAALLGAALSAGAADLETDLWLADNGQDDAMAIGVGLTCPLAERLDLQLAYAQGRFNPGGDVERLDLARGLLLRPCGPVGVGLGYAWIGFDTQLQPGWEWSYPDEAAERNADAHGPVVHVQWRRALGAGPWALGLAGTCMPHDFGGFDELGADGANLDLQGGLLYAGARVEAGLGWRGLYFADLPRRSENERTYGRNRTQGLQAHLTLRF